MREYKALPGATEFYFFKTINYLMEIEDEVCSIRHKKPASTVEALFISDYWMQQADDTGLNTLRLESIQFLEE